MSCEHDLCTLIGKQIHGRLLEIWDGKSGLSKEKEQSYRDIWIAGSGRPASDFGKFLPDQPKGPGILKKAANLTKAVVKHVNNPTILSDADKEKRLLACRNCSYCDKAKMICSHKKCGCFLSKKSGWESEDCPVGRWPSLNLEPKLDREFVAGPRVQKFLVNWYGESGDCMQHHLRGAPVFLFCGGPSLNSMDLEIFNQRGIVTASVNQVAATHIRPRYAFFVDPPRKFHTSIWDDPGIMKFTRRSLSKGKLAVDTKEGWQVTGKACRDCPNTWFYENSYGLDINDYMIREKPTWGGDLRRGENPVATRSTRNVMLIAMRMLYWLGSRNVFLVGADFNMQEGNSYAFKEPKDKRAASTNNNTYTLLNGFFHDLKPVFKQCDFEVINCTPASHIDAFPRMDYREAVSLVTEKWKGSPNVSGLYRL